ncbi:MAG: metal-binding protein [Mesorhizobium sp. SCN 65-12]|nr:MAG: metal-binding protein [Mesorhizobium sp. SCN 65-12]
MHEQPPQSPVSFPVQVARLPQKGLAVTIEADPAQRAALAAEHGLSSVAAWRAELEVKPWKRNGVKVAGRVRAEIVQACVVTLEPLEAHIDEAVEGLFLPQDSKLGRVGFDRAGEIVLDADGPDGPETFSGDSIDVGALAEQFFALAVDPYPRKPGAALDNPGEETGQDESEFRQKLRSLFGKS